MEIWKDVKNFEGYYKVSDKGRIITFYKKSQNHLKKCNGGFLLNCSKNKDNIKNVCLFNRETKYTRQVRLHILIAETFIGEKPSKKHKVRAKDGDYLNLNIDNLHWSDKSTNIKYIPPNNYVPEYDDYRTTYIYYLYDTRDGSPRYVGKTIRPLRRLKDHLQDAKAGKKNHKCNWIRKVLNEGGDINMSIIDEIVGDWTWLEQLWAKFYIAKGENIIFDGGWVTVVLNENGQILKGRTIEKIIVKGMVKTYFYMILKMKVNKNLNR